MPVMRGVLIPREPFHQAVFVSTRHIGKMAYESLPFRTTNWEQGPLEKAITGYLKVSFWNAAQT